MECHPYCQQTKLKDYCDSKGQENHRLCLTPSTCLRKDWGGGGGGGTRLNFDPSHIAIAIALGFVLQAHSPLGTPTRPPHYNDPSDPTVMEDPVVLDIAKKHSVHPALVSIYMDACDQLFSP
jgi:diketogulonate reductase-like aldo/keto reductase